MVSPCQSHPRPGLHYRYHCPHEPPVVEPDIVDEGVENIEVDVPGDVERSPARSCRHYIRGKRQVRKGINRFHGNETGI
jgi:hypothetical protein